MIDISVKQANTEGSAESRVVTITKQDNKTLVNWLLSVVVNVLRLSHCGEFR